MLDYTELSEIFTKALKVKYVGTKYDKKFVYDCKAEIYESSDICGTYFTCISIEFLAGIKHKKWITIQ